MAQKALQPLQAGYYAEVLIVLVTTHESQIWGRVEVGGRPLSITVSMKLLIRDGSIVVWWVVVCDKWFLVLLPECFPSRVQAWPGSNGVHCMVCCWRLAG